MATNTFGEAYVVPSIDTFENIRECLGATAVTLPHTEDLTARSKMESLCLPTSPEKSKSFGKIDSGDCASTQVKLRTRKAWNHSFSDYRSINDQSYVHSFMGLNTERELLDFFLEPAILSSSRWTTHQEREFLDTYTKSHLQSAPLLYLDDRYRGCRDHSGDWLPIDQLGRHLRDSKPWSYDPSQGCHRQLM